MPQTALRQRHFRCDRVSDARPGRALLRRGAGFGVIKPHDGNAATVGNGVMPAIAAKDKAQVDRIYKLAMDMGAKDEGAPGPRGDGGFYAAYFRDPDGNKLNAFVMG